MMKSNKNHIEIAIGYFRVLSILNAIKKDDLET